MGQFPDWHTLTGGQAKTQPSPLENMAAGQDVQGEQESPSFWDRIGRLPGAAATGVRIGGGVLASPGGFFGSLMSAGSEGVAELIEKPESLYEGISAIPEVVKHLSNSETRGSTAQGFAEGAKKPIARMAAEGALGFVPGSAVTKTGKAVQSGLRSSAMAEAGYAGRTWANDEDFDPMTGLKVAGLGFGLGAGASRIGMGRGVKPLDEADRLAKANEVRTAAGGTPRIPGRPQPTTNIHSPVPEGSPDDMKQLERLFKSGMNRADSRELEFNRQTVAAQKAAQKAEQESARVAENDSKLDTIRAAREEAEAAGKPPTFSESISAKNESGGSERMSVRYGSPAEEAEKEAAKLAKNPPVRGIQDDPVVIQEASGVAQTAPATKVLADVQNGKVPEAPVVSDSNYEELVKMFGGGKPANTPRVTILPEVPGEPRLPSDITPDIPPVGPVQPNEDLLNFFKGPAEASGNLYKQVKAAAPNEPKLREPLSVTDSKGKPYTSERIAGKNARQAAAKEGIPPLSQQKVVADPEVDRVAPPMIADETTPPTGGKWVDDELRDIEKNKEMARQIATHKPSGPLDPSGEKGAVSYDALIKMMMGGGGALMGAASNPDHPIMGALGGGAAGLGLSMAPQILRSLGSKSPLLDNLDEHVSREGITNSASNIIKELPHVQRFNYLMSGHGLAANAAVGPYMSGLQGAVEAGLKGDARGWKALQHLLSMDVFDEMGPAYQQAAGLVESAERRSLQEAPNAAQRALAYPGQILTTGDLTIRNILKKAGFSDDEAKLITMTNEPGGKSYVEQFGKSMTNAQRTGGPIANMVLPFVRTPMNMLARGVERFPVLGGVYQALKGKSAREIGAEQMLSIPTAAASYEAGKHLDEPTGGNARRYVQNAGGQNALTSSIFYALGKEMNKRNPNTSNALAKSVVGGLALPQTDAIESWIKMLSGGGNGKMPPGSYPKMWDELSGSDAVKPTNAPTNIPDSLSNIPLRRRGQ